MTSDIKAYIDSLSTENQEEVYKYLKAQRVRKDVVAYASQICDKDLTDKQVKEIVRRYVYDHDYSHNVDYWSNLKNLIFSVINFYHETN